MKYIKYILIGSLIISFGNIWSQQETVITQYFESMNLINPAYAGVGNETVITSIIRAQWTGIAEAPETQTLAASTYLGSKVGLGITMISDKTFIEKQTFLGLDFSYKLQLSRDMDMYFGIKAGGNFYDVNTSGLETYNIQADPALFGINSFNPNIGAGILLKRGKSYLSLSVPRMLNTERTRNNDGVASLATDRPHFYATLGHDFTLNQNETLFLYPSVLMRYVNGAPISVDINTRLSFEDKLTIGATYRTDGSFAGMASVTFLKVFTFGYAYEVATKSELARANNTNELLLRARF